MKSGKNFNLDKETREILKEAKERVFHSSNDSYVCRRIFAEWKELKAKYASLLTENSRLETQFDYYRNQKIEDLAIEKRKYADLLKEHNQLTIRFEDMFEEYKEKLMNK